MKATKSSEEYRKILKAKPPKTITKTRYQASTSSQRFPATTRSLNHRAPSRYQQGTNRERSRYYNKRAAHSTTLACGYGGSFVGTKILICMQRQYLQY
ncbi:unnamed protein product [Acanthoscelides obtectus]|uniref:Uncharacterized protein n=1 Tax=Acanthoscelides obtectus TaxID=200917 RepID=A0A9P0LX81_ACAOB|nr:unnamed protein product [Acanthoscelides obtectus]CAK1687728.1 hypothetical protein AOBTE_LOCUS36339 [Acanthoscelides obtectus]